MKKWITITIIALLIVGGSIWFYQSKKDAAQPEQQVMTATVQKGDLKVQVSGSGSVSSINSSDITTESEGIIDEVLVDENDIVEKGDELATFTDGSDPITAPCNGTITSLTIEDGSRIQLNDVVGHITDYKNLQTVITVDELDITNLKKGQTAEMTADAFPDETFTGTVTAVAKEGTAENGVSSFEVTVQFKDPKALRIGMSTEVKITTESKENILYVPIEAVKISGDKKYVTLQDSNSSEDSEANSTQQEVETGINDDQHIEIVSGLKKRQTIELQVINSTNKESTNGEFPTKDKQDFPSNEGGASFPFPGNSGGQGMPSGQGRGGQ